MANNLSCLRKVPLLLVVQKQHLEEQSNQYPSPKAYLKLVLFKLKSIFIISNLNKR
jgi:hypothetical protein